VEFRFIAALLCTLQTQITHSHQPSLHHSFTLSLKLLLSSAYFPLSAKLLSMFNLFLHLAGFPIIVPSSIYFRKPRNRSKAAIFLASDGIQDTSDFIYSLQCIRICHLVLAANPLRCSSYSSFQSIGLRCGHSGRFLFFNAVLLRLILLLIFYVSLFGRLTRPAGCQRLPSAFRIMSYRVL